MIKQIKEFLSRGGKYSLVEISSNLKFDREMVKHALNMLSDKKLILVEEVKSPCKGCKIGGSCFGTSCAEDNISYSLK